MAEYYVALKGRIPSSCDECSRTIGFGSWDSPSCGRDYGYCMLIEDKKESDPQRWGYHRFQECPLIEIKIGE